MKKSLIKLLGLSLSFLLLVTTTTVHLTAAKTNEESVLNQVESLDINPTEKLEDSTMYILENSIDVTEEKQERLLNLAYAAIETGEVNYHGSNDLVFENPSVRGIQYEDGVYYAVAFNYTDEEAVSRMSVFNVVFDSEENIVNSFELDMKKLNDNQASVNYWTDGEVTTNEIFDISGLTTTDEEITTMGWTSCMQSCLAGKGMSMWAIALLAVLCGASCTVGVPATAGTACYACVNTAGIIGVSAFLDCWKNC